jgi:uncharacterized membrane protein YbhN (UPF0104 family)
MAGLARWLGALALVAALVWAVDPRAVGARLVQLDLRWVAAFGALSVVHYVVVALRWSFTAARVGAPIPFARALAEYYLSTLLNQLLPVGLAGDVARAARHRLRIGGERAAWGPAARAVVLERISGLVALAPFVVGSALVWIVRGRRELLAVGVGALALVAGGALLLRRAAKSNGALARDGRAALVERGALGAQIALSTTAVAILVGQFACAARATGVALDPATALAVVPLVLASTTIPWAFAGWGVREASAAALYALAGLDAASGVAVSITFGLLSLGAALPGAIALVLPSGRTR